MRSSHRSGLSPLLATDAQTHGLRLARPPAFTKSSVLALLLALSSSLSLAGEAKDPALWKKAQALHQRSIVVDTHNDVTSTILEDGFDLGSPNGNTHTDLPRLKSGGMTAEFFSIYVDRSFVQSSNRYQGGSARRALDMIDGTYQQIERHPKELRLALTSEDIRQAKKEGRVAVLMGIEGGHAIENSLAALRGFYRLGVRYMTLTHSNTNDWADSSGTGEGAEVRHHGLSPFGESVVKEMQRMGMLVDISHISDEAVEDVLRIAKAPVIASHSSARAVADHPRNLTDEQLKAVAKNGGVVMVNFYTQYIDPRAMAAAKAREETNKAAIDAIKTKYKDDRAALWKNLKVLYDQYPLPPTPLSVLIDHIDHIAKVAGVDSVGLGSDFDGVPSLPEDMQGVDALPNITYELLKRGYSEGDVQKILGLNFLRVMEAAEKYSRDTHSSLSGNGNTEKIPDPSRAKSDGN